MKSWKKDFVAYFNFKTPTVMKCYLNVKILCFITKWPHQYSPSFTIKNLSAGSLAFLISSSMSGLLAAASISSLHTFLHHVRIALELIFFCLLGFPCLPLSSTVSHVTFPAQYFSDGGATGHFILLLLNTSLYILFLSLEEALPLCSPEHYGMSLRFIAFGAVRLYEVILNASRLHFFSGSVILLCLWITAHLTVLYPPLLKRGHAIKFLLGDFWTCDWVTVRDRSSINFQRFSFVLYHYKLMRSPFLNSCLRSLLLSSERFHKNAGSFSLCLPNILGFCWLSTGL